MPGNAKRRAKVGDASRQLEMDPYVAFPSQFYLCRCGIMVDCTRPEMVAEHLHKAPPAMPSHEDVVEALCARIAELEASLADCSREFHSAIHEAEYAGTRKDWIERAQAAEAKVQELERSSKEVADLNQPNLEQIMAQAQRIQELEREVARLKDANFPKTDLP